MSSITTRTGFEWRYSVSPGDLGYGGRTTDWRGGSADERGTLRTLRAKVRTTVSRIMAEEYRVIATGERLSRDGFDEFFRELVDIPEAVKRWGL